MNSKNIWKTHTNKEHNMADILHLVGVQADRKRVFEALSQQADLQGWWSQFTEAEARVGAVNRVSFYGGMVVFELTVEILTPGERIVWAVTGAPPDWMGTKITWTLSDGEGPAAGQTMIHFAQTGFESMEGNFASVNYNWGWYLTSLKFYLEQGEGMPHTEADMP
jgi:uncharacterized protein YndB with AHSA1/START domain